MTAAGLTASHPAPLCAGPGRPLLLLKLPLAAELVELSLISEPAESSLVAKLIELSLAVEAVELSLISKPVEPSLVTELIELSLAIEAVKLSLAAEAVELPLAALPPLKAIGAETSIVEVLSILPLPTRALPAAAVVPPAVGLRAEPAIVKALGLASLRPVVIRTGIGPSIEPPAVEPLAVEALGLATL